MSVGTTPVIVAIVAAAMIAGTGFAVAQIFGEGAGMPLVALASTLWTAYFVHLQSTRRTRT